MPTTPIGRLVMSVVLCVCASCSHGGITLNKGVMDIEPGSGPAWTGSCRIHRPCEKIEPMPTCPRGTKVATIPVTPPSPETTEMFLSLRGRLFVPKTYGSTQQGCEPGVCCHHTWQSVLLLGEAGERYELPDLGCFGDDSRLCCNVIAEEQEVVVTGTVRLTGEGAAQELSFLSVATLCALEA